MTTLRVLLHVAAQRDYELHSLDFSTAFLQGSLHEEIWLRRLPGFTESFPPGTQWSLRQPVYGLRQAPREWHDTLRTTLAALGFAPSTTDPSLFLRTDTSLPPFYILVYVDDLVFATADTAGLAHVKSELQKRHTCTDLGELRIYLGLQITRDRAQRTITLTQLCGDFVIHPELALLCLTGLVTSCFPTSSRHSTAITIRASPPSRFPAPSAVAMKPCARLPGLCGLAALVAGLVAISFLATHARAAGKDLCVNLDCGEATCTIDEDVGAFCECTGGFEFDKVHKTCVDPCPKMDCGEATCKINVDFGADCVCKDGFVFDETRKTCVDPCAGGVCGVEASCSALAPTEFLCNCNKEGFAFNEADKTCFAPLARTTVALKARGFAVTDASFLSPLPAEQAGGTTVCGNLDVMLQGNTKISVVWNASNPVSHGDDAPSNAMCKSLSFYAESFCKEKLGFKIARPAKKGSSYPVTIK
ncbi:unnamed protein product [Closterium sp. NIES-54]